MTVVDLQEMRILRGTDLPREARELLLAHLSEVRCVWTALNPLRAGKW
jgi:hypothetical protein